MISSLPMGVGALQEVTEGLGDHGGPRKEAVLVDSSIEFDN